MAAASFPSLKRVVLAPHPGCLPAQASIPPCAVFPVSPALCHHDIFIATASRRPLSGVVTGERLDPVRRRKQMPKSICIATLVTMIAIAPAYSAAPKECTDAHMKQMDALIAKMTDAAKKKEATTALDMSKADMKKGNMEGCMKYMKQAHTAMGL